MSTSSKKGYVAERAIETMLQRRYPNLAGNILRPRAGAPADKGDIHGLPVVISVKNWADPHLGPWVNEMQGMCVNSGKGVGVVWHKRRGTGNPEDWYVTTDEKSYFGLIDKYGENIHLQCAGVVVSAAKLSGWLKITHDEAGRRNCEVGVLMHNRVGKDTDRFFTMTGRDFLTLLDVYLRAGLDRGMAAISGA